MAGTLPPSSAPQALNTDRARWTFGRSERL